MSRRQFLEVAMLVLKVDGVAKLEQLVSFFCSAVYSARDIPQAHQRRAFASVFQLYLLDRDFEHLFQW
jgi:hypothetical protein